MKKKQYNLQFMRFKWERREGERRRKVEVEEDEKVKQHGVKKVKGKVEAAERSGREVNILPVRWKSHREAATLKKGKSEGRKRERRRVS